MRVITFGEIMLRLSPPMTDRFLQTHSFDATYGGAEANVAVSLANYGIPAAFVTKLPAHEIGQCAVNELRKYGVDTSMIVRGGDRVGIYYCETGASQRGGKVIYDRAHSSISEATVADFDWQTIFNGADWFHFTGITPALSQNAFEICLAAVQAAKAAGVTVSTDLNYRKKLWSRETACARMSELVRYCDLVIANEADCRDVFSIESADTDVDSGKLNKSGYTEVAAKLSERFGCTRVAITLRESISASDNLWSAMLYDNGESYFSNTYPIHIVDRVGGGDSFGAGLIYGYLQKMSPREALEFAVAASCLKHSIPGDFNLVSVDEVYSLIRNGGSGRVQR